LDRVLGSPDVAPLVAKYDELAGKPGSFLKQVIRHGDAEFRDSEGKRDLSPQECVAEVLAFLGLKNANQGAGQAPKPNDSATAAKVVVVKDKTAVIPNVGSGSANPALGKKPKSIEDIRAIAKAKMQEAG
jgi:hypothetical protein